MRSCSLDFKPTSIDSCADLPRRIPIGFSVGHTTFFLGILEFQSLESIRLLQREGESNMLNKLRFKHGALGQFHRASGFRV